MNTIPRTFHPSHRVLPLLLHLLQNTKKMHLYNAWLPPPVAQETKREKDSFSRVVCSVKNSYKPDDPDSVYSTLKWISVIDLWAFFNFLCSFLFMFFLFQSYQFVFDLGSFFFFLNLTLNFGSSGIFQYHFDSGCVLFFPYLNSCWKFVWFWFCL